MIYLYLRQIDAHDTRRRMRRGERNEATPCCTADFEHTGSGHVSDFQPEEVGYRGQVPRGRLGKRIRGIRRRVVVGAQLVDRVVEVAAGALVGRLSHYRSLVSSAVPPGVPAHNV